MRYVCAMQRVSLWGGIATILAVGKHGITNAFLSVVRHALR